MIISIPVDLVLMTFLATGFQSVDMDTSGSLISCLETIGSHPFFCEVKEESFRLLQISKGDRVLEVGCGTGADAWKLTQSTGFQGLVAGVDPGLVMIRKAISAGKDPFNLNPDELLSPYFIRGDGRYLGFSDETFHAVREDRALQHIAQPELVVAEMLRVLRSGGKFVLFEPDWELFIIEGSEKGLTRRILNFWADQFMNGWVGRSLHRICLDCAVQDLTILPRTLILHDLTISDQIFGIRDTITLAIKSGVIKSDEAVEWLSYLEKADRSGLFFCSFTGYLVHGRKGQGLHAFSNI